MIQTFKHLLLVGALAGAAVLGAAAVTTSPAALAAEQLSKQDRDFVEEAAMGGLMEVKLGEVAQQRAVNEDVKKFGQRMVEDHTKINQRLAQLAAQKGIGVPDKLDKKSQAKVDELSKLSGAKLDKQYMSEMVAVHGHDVAAFQKQAKAAQDPDLAALVNSALPTLQDHLALAKQLEARLGGGK
jgi:putative membrane protein